MPNNYHFKVKVIDKHPSEELFIICVIAIKKLLCIGILFYDKNTVSI